MVVCYSAGTDNIDAAALAARRIPLTTTSPALAEDVADLAMALVVMARRRLVAADAHVRTGRWAAGSTFPLGQGLQGLRLGVLGFGHIGAAVARRAAAAGMRIHYCARRPRKALELPFHADPVALARNSDVLVVACSGGQANRGLVGAEAIHALGAGGTLVNVARGDVVDEEALIRALATGALGSAGLDVFQDEPRVDPRLTAMPFVVLTPHIGSATVEGRAAMGRMVLDSLCAALDGDGDGARHA